MPHCTCRLRLCRGLWLVVCCCLLLALFSGALCSLVVVVVVVVAVAVAVVVAVVADTGIVLDFFRVAQCFGWRVGLLLHWLTLTDLLVVGYLILACCSRCCSCAIGCALACTLFLLAVCLLTEGSLPHEHSVVLQFEHSGQESVNMFVYNITFLAETRFATSTHWQRKKRSLAGWDGAYRLDRQRCRHYDCLGLHTVPAHQPTPPPTSSNTVKVTDVHTTTTATAQHVQR